MPVDYRAKKDDGTWCYSIESDSTHDFFYGLDDGGLCSETLEQFTGKLDDSGDKIYEKVSE